jgi:AcrR family transcriptional regulator
MARPPKDPQIRINEILDAAEPLFYSNGYHETAISDIVKKLGVAQGTVYYYFKSKEEILEALIKREISKLLLEVEPLAYSDNIAAPLKFNLVINAIFRAIKHKETELLFEFLYDDRTLHLVDKLSRQGKQVVIPLIKRIIEEGIQQKYFHVVHSKVAMNMIMAIIQSITDAIYEKELSDDLITYQFKLAEDLIEKILGAQPETIQIFMHEN